jgi:NAD dependent epimerase/dehydratase
MTVGGQAEGCSRPRLDENQGTGVEDDIDLKGRRVTVTGADGFIGSHLVEALVRHGAQVTAFCFYNSFDSRGWLDSLDPEMANGVSFVMGDVRDFERVRTSLAGRDAVFHLAALVGIPFSYESPRSYVDTNVVGTLNVLQAARDCDLHRVVVTSTSEVYGTALYVPIDEEHPRQAQSPYSASKIAADKLAESYYRSFDLPVVVARPFNTYGPRQSARAVVPTIIAQLLHGEDSLHLGSLHPRRDLNYVSDTVAGFIALAECDEAVGKEVNIGSGEDISIGELARLLIDIMGSSATVVSEDARKRPPLSEVERLVCSSNLIASLTGWRPAVSLREGLQQTVDWFRSTPSLPGYRPGYSV